MLNNQVHRPSSWHKNVKSSRRLRSKYIAAGAHPTKNNRRDCIGGRYRHVSPNNVFVAEKRPVLNALGDISYAAWCTVTGSRALVGRNWIFPLVLEENACYIMHE